MRPTFELSRPERHGAPQRTMTTVTADGPMPWRVGSSGLGRTLVDDRLSSGKYGDWQANDNQSQCEQRAEE